MTKKTPIKRSQELVVLSQEHHHALVFCMRLKKAHQTEGITLQLFVNDFWSNELAPHFKNEEKWLLPELEDNEIKKQFIAEHQQIRTLVQRIKNSTEDYVAIALQLAEILNNHVRFEERKMFPYLETKITAHQFALIGKALSKKEITCHNFTPEFWKNEPSYNNNY